MAATDVLSLSRAKRALSIGDGSTQFDDTVSAYVGAVSSWLDRACGPVVRRNVTETVDGSAGCVVTLRNAPYSSFTTVTEYVGSTPTVLTAETVGVTGDYLVESFHVPDPAGLLAGRLRRRSGMWDRPWACGVRNVTVVAVAGRYATTAALVGTRFDRAAQLLLKHLWQAETLNVATSGDYDVPTPSFPRTMPLIVRQLLGADWLDDLAVA